MISLASIIERFESSYLAQYQGSVLPSHRHALAAIKGHGVRSCNHANASLQDLTPMSPHQFAPMLGAHNRFRSWLRTI